MALEVKSSLQHKDLATEAFIQREYSKSVPNHLTETKIFGQVSRTAIIEAKPAEVHFAGFQIDHTEICKLKLTNISDDPQRVHIIPPSTPYFDIKYEKQARLVPGLSININVELHPKEWKYYNDCIRVHCKDDQNLMIPIHAYPVLINSSDFPRKIDFPVTPLAKSISRVIPLRSSVPVDFEFEIRILEPNDAYTITPVSGCVAAKGSEDIVITFTPNDYATAHMKFQLLVSQFNSEAFICGVTGSSEPGLVRKQLVEKFKEDSKNCPKDVSVTTATNYDSILDPSLLKPIERSRYKKTMKKTTKSTMNTKVIENFKVPLTLSCPSEVARILNQKDGKMNVKELKQAVEMFTESTSNRQMKEAIFEQQVRQYIMEERANELRWMVHPGDSAMTLDFQESILQARDHSINEYKIYRGEPQMSEEVNRTVTECTYRRTFRPSNELPQCEPTFDLFTNDNWAKRHSTIQKFIQAARKIIIRARAQKHLESLQVLVDNWRRGHFRPMTPDSDEGSGFTSLDVVPHSIRADRVLQYRIPVYSIKDEMEPDAIGKVPLEPSDLVSKHYLCFFDLKVPQQYRLMGYQSHAVQPAIEGYVTPNVSRPLRVGAGDELISLPTVGANSTSYGSDQNNKIDSTQAEIANVDLEAKLGDEDNSSAKSQMEQVLTEIPQGIIKPVEYPPMTIFNQYPGIRVYYPPLKYSEIDENYYFSPLPRFKQHTSMNPTGNQNVKPFLDKKSIIPGIMKWKRFSSQSLLALGSTHTISSVWLPRWSDPFNSELLPEETPQLLDSLPDDDIIDSDDKEEDNINLPMPTPEMIRAEFGILDAIEKDYQDFSVPFENNKLPTSNIPISKFGLKSRQKCAIQLESWLLEDSNQLGKKIETKVDALDSQITHPGMHIK